MHIFNACLIGLLSYNKINKTKSVAGMCPSGPKTFINQKLCNNLNNCKHQHRISLKERLSQAVK